MGNNKTFVKISNQQVYNELCKLKNDNENQHEEIKDMISKYQGQMSRLKLAIGGIGTISMATLGWLISHLL